ncbi:hypothetical protein [Flavobacterium soyangense]|uniref:Uncharacterized protein n=1 Tax=Flavobacterium soyangense TaxID=2023265 RepID=A0A930XWU0_9FLAO|nr:hypothetical protein [Flavobacterium soyangense]MBF2709741.1 hypothetical protein [Flavobacterium soyangense]
MNVNDNFPDWKEHTDTLIKLFSDQGWKFDELRPQIVLVNNKIRELPNNKNGLHGPWYSLDNYNKKDYSEEVIKHTYLLSDYDRIDGKPIINIYTHVLIQTALLLLEHFSIKTEINGEIVFVFVQEDGTEMDFDIAMKNIFYCALLNETAKWILVDVVDVNDNTWQGSPLKEKDHLHECLTVLFTHWVVNSTVDSRLHKTFEWLFNTLHTKGEYLKYKNFIHKKADETNEDNKIKKNIINCTEIARFKNIIEVEMFKKFFDDNSNFKNLNASGPRGQFLKKDFGL